LEFWFPKAIYTTASDFIWNDEPDLCTEDQTALIPWVQSIVIKHYVLGKEVFFQGQDNYIGLYSYLNDFVALYLIYGLRCIIGNNISLQPNGLPYAENDCQNPTLFVSPEHVDWDPEEQHTPPPPGKGFIVPLFNKDILLHNYQLHQNNTTTIWNYQLKFFLQTGGIEPPCDDSKNSTNLFGSDLAPYSQK
jgi:hypothetical protein